MQKGVVFDIQRYSIEDGPGIRTVIFLKGCPLKCRWCANPESQQIKPQILFDASACQNCGSCIDVCPQHFEGTCTACGACERACWYGARKICGKTMTTEQVMEVVRRDVVYYRANGGITLSGGEPLMQAEFAAEILAQCRAEGINTAIETAGYAPWTVFEAILKDIDLVYFDCKHAETRKHHEFTGVGNALIIQNLERMCAKFENTIVRIPCIPGFNDTYGEMEQIFRLLQRIGARKVEVLPFHRFGSDKYRELGRRYDYENTPPMKAEQLVYVDELGRMYGLDACVKKRNS